MRIRHTFAIAIAAGLVVAACGSDDDADSSSSDVPDVVAGEAAVAGLGAARAVVLGVEETEQNEDAAPVAHRATGRAVTEHLVGQATLSVLMF